MHHSLLNEELLAFQDSLQKWIKQHVTPFHDQWERDGIVPKEVYRWAGEQGFLCPTIPEKYGGLGLDFRYSALVIEELAKAGASGLAFYLHSDIVAPYILHYGSEAQKQKYLPKMVSGEFIGAIAMTEPDAGSDLQKISTKAEHKDNSWILNGQKTFCSNGICCDFVIVVAQTPLATEQKFAPQSLFIVDDKTPGFERGRNLTKIGLKAQDTAELYFQNCKVPESALMGEVGQAFVYLNTQLGRERLAMAIYCTAQSRTVLNDCIKYCKEREAFGKTIGEFQNTRFKLAELDTEISLAECFVDRCLTEFNENLDIRINASKAKYWCSDLLGKVTDTCLQFYGGYGYMHEYPISRHFVDARVQRIFGGTTEIMKEIISRNLFKA